MQIKAFAEDRKVIVKTVEEILGIKAKYMGPPSFAYRIGDFIISREGNIDTENEQAGKELNTQLANRGIGDGEPDVMNISIPLNGMEAGKAENLVNMIHGRQYLLNRAIGKEVFFIPDEAVQKIGAEDNLTLEGIMQILERAGIRGFEIDPEAETVAFTGLPLTSETTGAYTVLFAAMVKSAGEQKKVSPKEVIVENEKYYFRAWLVRIGLGGKEMKEERKVLLAKLKGHTAFRTEADRERWKEKNQGKKESTEG